jgi:spermidine synthase
VEEPVTIERVSSPRGEVVLRKRGGVYEIVSNGTFLMDTAGGASERLLARVASAGGARRVLIGGLGVGFTLAEALAAPGVESVTVVEVEDAVVRWNRRESYDPLVVYLPKTWLLQQGWLKHGLVSFYEVPSRPALQAS